MGNLGNWWLHLILVSIFLVATTYTCFGVENTSVICSEQERLALLKFKQSIQAHLGMTSSWVGNECCEWKGIQCDIVTGHVQSLRLRGDMGHLLCSERRSLYYGYIGGFYHSLVSEGYLSGNEVNSSLAELRHLKYLDLSGNDFGGSRIPEFIGSFKQLTYLNLSTACFEGTVPPHIGNLSALKVLDLSFNRMLTTHDMAWTFRLSSLEHLNLNLVDLGKALNRNMMLYMIPSLKSLSLSGCGLSNADLAPFLNLSRILPNIKHLDLGFNSFKGPFPGFFQNMTSLAFLDISGFDLSSVWNFGNLLNMIPSVSELHLSSCGLDKTFLSSPHLNFSTLSNIQHLDLSNNSIGGIFPSILTNMSSLKVLDLSRNRLRSSIHVMPNLLQLDLSFNMFKQIENVKLWRLANLRGIDLSSNRLEGPIPESLGRLRFLEVLDLSNNQLTGLIPTFLGDLTKLDLSYNQLNGSIPSSLVLHPSLLSQLILNDNNLSGELPQELGNQRFLRVLHLGSNNLSGNIPDLIGDKLTYLVVLILRENNFTGRIPVSMCKGSNLQMLDVSQNRLTEIIPRCMGDLNAMSFLMDLSSNKLVGGIPVELTALSMLIGLNLSDNHLSGGIPDSIGNMKNLSILDLSRNALNGIIPPSMTALTFLYFFNLSHNNLWGQIPKSTQMLSVSETCYAGNKDLCGPPLPKSCSNHVEDPTPVPKKEPTKVWLFYVDIMSGFATGFLGVIGVLLLKKKWRQKLFMFAEKTMDEVYVAVRVKDAGMRRGREAA